MNRAQRRLLARKAPHLLQDSSHVCQDGAHVLYHAELGYLTSINDTEANFAKGDDARTLAQRFHQECATHFAARLKGADALELAVRHQTEAEAEGWQ